MKQLSSEEIKSLIKQQSMEYEKAYIKERRFNKQEANTFLIVSIALDHLVDLIEEKENEEE